ncbi:hypothetical protein KGQ20_16480 [Catenulispora sp. NF23]|uniref:DNA-binding protein n=1 Tax=Catenulispora pinistramenti TaxID=2705254 RepID=A0ABS5KYN4_9ACTN|nr:hypothetical protein [Catenulispora pinistramenti]MBS2534368.1 hypothetical protein [Catenulispora pinistramenti]MBS2551180.1 hypothetical protein [Catenulispora pinistramenti]
MKFHPNTRLTFPVLFDLPVSVDLKTAASAFGMCPGTAYRLIGVDRFPCQVLRPGWRYIVPTVALMDALGIDMGPVQHDGVLAGLAAGDDSHEQDIPTTEDPA